MVDCGEVGVVWLEITCLGGWSGEWSIFHLA